DIQIIRDQPDTVRKAIRDKKIGSEAIVDELLGVDENRRRLTAEVQDLQTQSNEGSGQIGRLMKEGKRDEAQQIIAQTSSIKESLKAQEELLHRIQERFDQLMLEIPNVPHESVPMGSSPEDNEIVFESGHRPVFSFDPLPHWELTQRHHLVDFERGSKV